METPQFTNRYKNDANYSSSNYLLCAPKKNQTKKTLAIKKNMILTSELATGLRKLDFNSSPSINKVILQHARLFQEDSPQTPMKRNNIFENEKESTIVQSCKRKHFEGCTSGYSDNYDMINENKSNTEKQMEKKSTNNTSLYNSEGLGKKLKPVLPFRSSIRFATKQVNQPLFNVFRDKEVHQNINSFKQSFKMQAIDHDCSTDDECANDQIKTLTESIVDVLQDNQQTTL